MGTLQELDDLAYKYGTDKTPRIKHPYTPFYYEYLKDKNIRTVLEIGIGNIGYYNSIIKRNKIQPVMGGSLKMWRDFYGAKVYGIDNREECMFEDTNIKTFIADATNPEQLEAIVKEIGDIDLVIDDASHRINHQISTAKILLPLLKKDVVYVIEDVHHPWQLLKGLWEYDYWMPDLPNRKYIDRLLIVHNK